VVVPVYSGEAFLPELVRRLDGVRTDWKARNAPMDLAEVILVDDAAIDGSAALIDKLAEERDWLTPLHLMRNFGQHAATIAGVLHSAGDWVVTMDEDLQHPPEAIEHLLKQAVLESADLVYAKPSSAVHESLSRDWASSAFKRLMVLVTGNANIRNFNSFRMMRGALARAASSVCGHETYFDVALSWFTKRITIRAVELKDERFIASAKSGYNIMKLLSHARRLLISSEVKILRLFGLLGVSVVFASMFGSIVLLLDKIFSTSAIAAGWTSLMLALIFFGGIATFMLTVVVEYLSILLQAAHGKPIFFTVDREVDRDLRRYFSSDVP
jgi:glycosyltransferase involved in cell wall biosynthesis